MKPSVFLSHETFSYNIHSYALYYFNKKIYLILVYGLNLFCFLLGNTFFFSCFIEYSFFYLAFASFETKKKGIWLLSCVFSAALAPVIISATHQCFCLFSKLLFFIYLFLMNSQSLDEAHEGWLNNKSKRF